MTRTVSLIQRLLAIIAVIILVFLAYSNHFNNPFEFDDEHAIVNNQHLRDLKNIPNFFKDGTTMSSLPSNQSYRPGLTTLNAIDFWLGGKEVPVAFFYHRSIFISYVILLICIQLFSAKVFESKFDKSTSFWLSVVTAAFFGVHTANAETINYIIQRGDSFSTLMVVLGFVIYLHFPKLRNVFLFMIPPVIGFLVKEPAIMFVPLLLVYKILFEQNDSSVKGFAIVSKKNLSKLTQQLIIPFGITLGLYLLSSTMTPENWTPGGKSRLHYMLTQPYVVLHYFNNFIIPSNLTIDTDWTPVNRILEDRVIIGIGFLAILLGIILKCLNRHRIISFGILWFLISLIPTSSIFPLAEVLNDHRPFFGYIGLSICMAYLFGLWLEYTKHKRTTGIIYGFILLIILGHVLGTRNRNQIWSSSESIWKEATIKSPNNGRAWMNYGNTQMVKGNWAEAEKCFLEAKKLWPHYSYVYINIGVLQSNQNRIKEAEANYKYALHCDQTNPACYSYYADFLFKQKRYKEAFEITKKGLQLSPKHTMLIKMHEMLIPFINNSNTEKSTLDIAIENVKLNPSPENYLALSLEYYHLGLFNECIIECNKALILRPNYDLAFNNMCSAYIQLGEWTLAVDACEKGLTINPNNETLKGNLNLAKNKKKF